MEENVQSQRQRLRTFRCPADRQWFQARAPSAVVCGAVQVDRRFDCELDGRSTAELEPQHNQGRVDEGREVRNWPSASDNMIVYLAWQSASAAERRTTITAKKQYGEYAHMPVYTHKNSLGKNGI